jgi:protein SCO1/2
MDNRNAFRGPRAPLARAVAAILLACAPLAACGPGAGSPPGAGQMKIGAPFHLVDQDGKPADEGVLKGQWSLMFFGYTYCPDACPTTLTRIGAASQALGPKAADLRTVFVSVDPERDTPAQLKAYMTSPVFPKNMVSLTGTPQEIASVAKNYGVYYARNGEGTDYLVDHSTQIYLFNPKGQFVELIRYDATPDDMAATIKKAMG